MSNIVKFLDGLLDAAQSAATSKGHTGLASALGQVKDAADLSDTFAQEHPTLETVAWIGAAVALAFLPEAATVAVGADLLATAAGRALISVVGPDIATAAANAAVRALTSKGAEDLANWVVRETASLFSYVGGTQTQVSATTAKPLTIQASDVGTANADLFLGLNDRTPQAGTLFVTPVSSGSGTLTLSSGAAPSVTLANGTWSNVSLAPDSTGAMAAQAAMSDGSSQGIVFHTDGSTTATSYSGPALTGDVTNIHQQNADGTAVNTAYTSRGQVVDDYDSTGTLVSQSTNLLSGQSITLNQSGSATYDQNVTLLGPNSNVAVSGVTTGTVSIWIDDTSTHRIEFDGVYPTPPTSAQISRTGYAIDGGREYVITSLSVGWVRPATQGGQPTLLETAAVSFPTPVLYAGLQGGYGYEALLIAPLPADAACFAEGTPIRTQSGDVPVERLVAGDEVMTGAGVLRPVRWIGWREVDCARHPCPRNVQPVRIAAHAFAANIPSQDIRLSPDHAVLAGDVLVPIRLLVNGTTIHPEPVPRMRYFHVELASHDVLLAAGLPCESYLDTGNRNAFCNAGPVVALHPDFAARTWECAACAPLVVSGAKLAAARRGLRNQAERLGRMTMSQAPSTRSRDLARVAPTHGGVPGCGLQ